VMVMCLLIAELTRYGNWRVVYGFTSENLGCLRDGMSMVLSVLAEDWLKLGKMQYHWSHTYGCKMYSALME
jgi:hypothetical protein